MNSIRYLRVHVLKCSQRELAVIAGSSQAHVSRWENGQASPGLDAMQRLRDEVLRRGFAWSDEWWFRPPTGTPPRAAAVA